MAEQVPVSGLEPGDVIEQEEIEIENVRKKNFVGASLEKVNCLITADFLNNYISGLQGRYGYSQIVGVTEDEIRKLKNNGVEKVQVKTGVRFIPAFPIALAITDLYGGGIQLLTILIS